MVRMRGFTLKNHANKSTQPELIKMVDERLKQKIKAVLKSGYFQDPADGVYVTDGIGDSIYVVGASEKFAGLRYPEKRS